MKKRLLATVLTLALLCPVMSYFMAYDANAALNPDSGASLTTSDNILNEEWNFDDMDNGETLTNGYIASHAKGNFTAATACTNGYAQPEKWTAVKEENGNVYIKAENGFLAFEDHDLLLAKNTYEISWKMKLTSVTSAFTLLMWSEDNGLGDGNRRQLLAVDNHGYLGYATNASNRAFTAAKMEIGDDAPWYSLRVRVSPSDGKMWVWLDGELVIDGVVNTYLRDNAKNAEALAFAIMYSWSGQSINSCLDDIKITPVKIDEYIDFTPEESETVDPVDVSWDFNDGTVADKGGVTVTAGNKYSIGNELVANNVISIVKTADVAVTGPKFTLPDTLDNYDSVTVSWKVKYVSANNYLNMFRVVKNDNTTQNLFRFGWGVFHFKTDGGESLGNAQKSTWTDVSVTIEPKTNTITTKVGDTEKTINDDETFTAIFNDLNTNEKPLSFYLYCHAGVSSCEIYLDDVSIKATSDGATVIDDSWSFNDGKVESTTDVTVDAGSNYDIAAEIVASDASDNEVIAASGLTVTGPKFTLPESIYSYEKITVSWKMKYLYSDNWINMFRIVKSDDGTQNLFRVDTYGTVRLLDNAGTNVGTVTKNEWVDVSVTINPAQNVVTTKIGTKEVTTSGNSTLGTIFSDLNDAGKELSFYLYLSSGCTLTACFDDVSIKATPVSDNIDEKIDFENLTADSTLTAADFNNALKGSGLEIALTGGGSIKTAADPDNAENTVIYDINKHMVFKFANSVKKYGTLELSFDVKFENMGGWTSLLGIDNDASGKYGRGFVISTEESALYAEDDETKLATLTQGDNAVWYTMDYKVDLSTFKVTLNVIERDTKKVVVDNATWTSTNTKTAYENDKAITWRLNYTWSANFKSYFDNIAVKTTSAPQTAENVFNSSWNDSSFSLISPTTAGMGNDDWEIAQDPAQIEPSGTWDFEDGKLTPAAQNEIIVTANGSSGLSVGTVDGDTVNTSNVFKITGAAEVGTPEFTLPGSIKNYKTIEVSFKVRIDSNTNLLNLLRIEEAGNVGNRTNLFRVNASKNSTTGELYTNINVGWNNSDGNYVNGTITREEWTTLKMVITPETGKVATYIGDTLAKEATVSLISTLYSGDKGITIVPFYQAGSTTTAYVDDVVIKTEYSDAYKAANNMTEKNYVIKTKADADGNVHGMLSIEDKNMYLADQPFEISFDYMMNHNVSDWTNLVKLRFDANGSKIMSIFRMSPAGTLYNAADSSNPGLNVVSKTLSAGTWYNLRMVVDPNTGHVAGYVDNELVCDYNFREYYNDDTLFVDPTKLVIEFASQWSSTIKTNDSCFDNIRIRTLNYEEVTKAYLTKTDFDSTAKGSLTAATFANATGLYAKSMAGTFTVAGTDEAKYVDATVENGDGININMTTGYGYLAADVLTFQGNFTFKSFGSEGKLNIYSLTRDDATAVSILSIDGDGKLYLGSVATSKTLEASETYSIKLVFSGISGTAELYVNDEFICAAAVTSEVSLSYKVTSNSAESTVYAGNRNFISADTTETTLSGVTRQEAELVSLSKISFPDDKLGFLTVEGNGTWNVAFDDLEITRDEKAYVYSDNSSDNFGFTDLSNRLWSNNFIVHFNATSSNGAINWNIGDESLVLAKFDGNTLYAADGTTSLGAFADGDEIAIVVNRNTWRNKSGNYVIAATVYVNGEVTGNHTLKTTKEEQVSTGVTFGTDEAPVNVSDVKIYFGKSPRDNHAKPADSGVKFDGYNAFSLDFENENKLNTLEANSIDYVEWAYPDFGTKFTDLNSASWTISELITEDENSFLRIRRPSGYNKPTAYMEYNLAAMGDYKDLYSVSLDMRYTDNGSSSVDIATIYTKNMNGKFTLLSADYEGKLYFEVNSIRYYLYTSDKSDLTVKPASSESFTNVAIVINGNAGTYSVWVDGTLAKYEKDDKLLTASELPIDYVDQDSYTVCDPKIRLLEGSNNVSSNSVIDIDNVSIDIIKNGLAPSVVGTQVNDLGNALRFVATVDTLYANEVGFDIKATSSLYGNKDDSVSGYVVYSSIIADGATKTAEELGGRYIMVVSVDGLKPDTYEFEVTPFIVVGGKKICGTAYTYSFNADASVE